MLAVESPPADALAEHDDRFAMLPLWLFRRPSLQGHWGTLAVLGVLLAFLNKRTGQCNPGPKLVMKYLGISKQALYAHLAILERQGLIRRHRRTRDRWIEFLFAVGKGTTRRSQPGIDLYREQPQAGSQPDVDISQSTRSQPLEGLKSTFPGPEVNPEVCKGAETQGAVHPEQKEQKEQSPHSHTSVPGQETGTSESEGEPFPGHEVPVERHRFPGRALATAPGHSHSGPDRRAFAEQFREAYPALQRDVPDRVLLLVQTYVAPEDEQAVLRGLEGAKCSRKWDQGYVPKMERFLAAKQWQEEPRRNPHEEDAYDAPVPARTRSRCGRCGEDPCEC
jgi:hypothetical protein